MNQEQQQTVAAIDIINAQVPGYKGLQQIVIRQNQIVSLHPMTEKKGFLATPLHEPIQNPKSKIQNLEIPVLDVAEDWISLGGVDLQINGALGQAFPEITGSDIGKLAEIGQFLWQQGVDGYLPTLVTSSVEQIQRSLSTLAEFAQKPPQPNSAELLGVHLEGPFLNPQKRGAHPQEHLLPLTLENVKRVLGDDAAVVKVMTLAPELDETGEVIPYLKGLGITVSLGHSQATATQAQQAFTQGATLVTHAFNAMPSLHHREPGLLGAALVNSHVQCGLIADGQHVCPMMIDVLWRSQRFNNLKQNPPHPLGIFLVSDALAPLGLPDGIYPWDERQIEVKQGTARLKDGTLAGTTLPLLVGVQNLVKWGICDVAEAIALATVAPRQALQLPILIGQPAHQLLRWQVYSSSCEELPILSWQRLFAESNS